MSVDVANVTDAAVMAALSVSAVTSIATGGVHRMVAKKGTTGTWVVFRRVDSPAEIRTMRSAAGATGRIVPLRYQVQAVTEGISAVPAERALAAVDAILDDGTLSLSAGTFLGCRRERLLGTLEDDLVAGRPFQITGAHYLVEVQV